MDAGKSQSSHGAARGDEDQGHGHRGDTPDSHGERTGRRVAQEEQQKHGPGPIEDGREGQEEQHGTAEEGGSVREADTRTWSQGLVDRLRALDQDRQRHAGGQECSGAGPPLMTL
jgi:hypothetical protein